MESENTPISDKKRMIPAPRLISGRINRQTKTLIEVDFGMNEPGTYQATCYGKHDSKGNALGLPHGFYVNADTLKSIMRISSNPLDWCGECKKDYASSLSASHLFSYESILEELEVI